MIVLLISVFLFIPLQESSLLCLAEIRGPDDLKYLSEKGLLAKKGCQDSCGDVGIPHPFGIRGLGDDKCYHNELFEITCNTSYHRPRPFLTRLNLEVMVIGLDEQQLAVKMKPQNVCSNEGVAVSIDLRGSPYLYSTSNIFTTWGSNGIIVKNRKGHSLTFCTPTHLESIFVDIQQLIGNRSVSCDHQIGCCEAQIYETRSRRDVDYYEINILNKDLPHGCNTTAMYWNKRVTIGYYMYGNGTTLDWYVSSTLCVKWVTR